MNIFWLVRLRLGRLFRGRTMLLERAINPQPAPERA